MAILIAVSQYDDARLPPVRAARNSVAGLYNLLVDPNLGGWHPDSVTVIENPRTPGEVEVLIAKASQKVEGELLLYYVGHASRDPSNLNLLLSVSTTDQDHVDSTSLRWVHVAEKLRYSTANVRVTVLDCCFSGQAIYTLSSGNELANLAHVEGRGAYTLAATMPNIPAKVPPPSKQEVEATYFTGTLLELVREGIPTPHPSLRMADIFPRLKNRLAAARLPEPTHLATDTAAEFIFANNVQYHSNSRPVAQATARSNGRYSLPEGTDDYVALGKILGRGSYAKVVLAENLTNKERVALKWPRKTRAAQARVSREIAAHARLGPHPNIMPIVDYDPEHRWFAMPVARGTLLDLRDEVDENAFVSILYDMAAALEFAHDSSLIHRDVSPANILQVISPDTHEHRWVLADWGLVKLEDAPAPRVTRTGDAMGTPGFEAPELDQDPRSASPAVDVYSLGRIAAWYATKKLPTSGHPLLPDGDMLHWRAFVRSCCELRIPSMGALRDALNSVTVESGLASTDQAAELLRAVCGGAENALVPLIDTALTHPEDSRLHLDVVARIPTSHIRKYATDAPERTARLAQQMIRHLLGPWGERDDTWADVPLSLAQAILCGLMDAAEYGYAEDVAESFFPADVFWNRATQRARTLDWLCRIEGQAAGVVARVIGRSDTVSRYYRTDRPTRSPLMSAILGHGADN